MKTHHVTQRHVIAVFAFVMAMCALVNTAYAKPAPGSACNLNSLASFHLALKEGDQIPLVITNPTACTWTAVPSASWIKVNPVSSNAPLTFMTITILPNIGPKRTGTVKIEGQQINISQNEGACVYQFIGPPKDFSAAGTSQTNFVGVVASSVACPRTAVADENWVKIVGGENDIGSGAIGYTVDPNVGSARSALIFLGKAQFQINQSSGCTFKFDSTEKYYPNGGTAGYKSVLHVTASSTDCQRSAVSNVPWIQIIDGVQSLGNGVVTYIVSDNPGPQRVGKITLGNAIFTINQGGGCHYKAFIPTSKTFGPAGGTGSFSVIASDPACPRNPVSSANWLTVTSASNLVGDGPINYSVAPSDGPTRVATLSIEPSYFSVTQDGAVVPTVTLMSLTPGFVAKGTTSFPLLVTGSNFTATCRVRWNGIEISTTFINSTSLAGMLTANELDTEGAFSVTVKNLNGGQETAAKLFMVYGAVANVSSASYVGEELAPASLVSAFSAGLAVGTTSANSLPLPTSLLGSSITVTDVVSKAYQVPLLFVSPQQINYVMPDNLPLGNATVLVKSANGHNSVGIVEIKNVAPGLLSANADGKGVAAAQTLRVKKDGSQIYDTVSQYDPQLSKMVPRPIDLSLGDPIYLVFYGTGFRYRTGLNNVKVDIGGVVLNGLYAGPAPGYAGLDQLNVLAPLTLIGKGVVEVVLTVDGKKANVVTLNFK